MRKLLVILGVFVLINIVFVGGQKWLNSGDSTRLDAIKAQLNAERPQIESMENDLRLLSQYNPQDTIYIPFDPDNPDAQPKAWWQKNEQARLNTLYAEYSERVDHYNELVDEANALAKKIGTTWYIVPRLGAFKGK